MQAIIHHSRKALFAAFLVTFVTVAVFISEVIIIVRVLIRKPVLLAGFLAILYGLVWCMKYL